MKTGDGFVESVDKKSFLQKINIVLNAAALWDLLKKKSRGPVLMAIM